MKLISTAIFVLFFYCASCAEIGIMKHQGLAFDVLIGAVYKNYPPKFGYFEVSSNANKAMLKWNTFSEASTHHFSIRKSLNGTSFYEIGMVKSANNSITMQAYHFEDTDLGEVSQIIYYEIVTVDADGKENVSPIKNLRNSRALKGSVALVEKQWPDGTTKTF